MTAPHARGERAPGTKYMTFQQVYSKRSTYMGDAVTDVDTGASPVTRWLTYALSYADFASNSGGTADVLNCLVPRGSMVFDSFLRLDTAFAGNGAADVDIGDSNQANGYQDGLDLSTDPSTTPLWFRDANALYIDKTSDITAGSAGAQYYVDGGAVVVKISTAPPTAGYAILFLATISYCEPQNSEWTDRY